MNTHSSKGKTGSKTQKIPLFTAFCTPGTSFTNLLPPPPPPEKKRRAKAHRALGNCDRMHEQTDFSTFSAKKRSKRAIFTKKRNKGRKKRAFPKGPKRAKKRASTFGKGRSVAAFRAESATFSSIIRQCLPLEPSWLCSGYIHVVMAICQRLGNYCILYFYFAKCCKPPVLNWERPSRLWHCIRRNVVFRLRCTADVAAWHTLYALCVFCCIRCYVQFYMRMFLHVRCFCML